MLSHLYSKAYIDLVNKMPEVPGWVYDKLDKPWKNERRRLTLDKLNTRPLVNPIPGQEERNSDHLLKAGVAIRCNNLPTMSYKLDKLLADSSRFSTMQANARKIAHPNAAREIVQRLIDLKPKETTHE